MGASLEVAKYTERLVPSTRFVAVDGVSPKVSETASFVAPSASVIGDVNMGSKSRYVYYSVNFGMRKCCVGCLTKFFGFASDNRIEQHLVWCYSTRRC